MSRIALVLFLTLTSVHLALAELEVKSDPNNYIARRIQGTWVLDQSISDDLGAVREPRRIRFKDSIGALKEIPEQNHQYLEQHRIYAAGYAYAPGENEQDNRAVFLLVEIDGNPVLLFFYDSSSEVMGTAESAYIHLVSGANPEKDLFFLGTADHEDAFLGYRRQ